MSQRNTGSEFVRGAANSSCYGSRVNNFDRLQHNVDEVNTSNASTSGDSNLEQRQLSASSVDVNIEANKRSLEECYSEANANTTSSGPLILRSVDTSDAVPQRLDLNVAYEDTDEGIQQEGTRDNAITLVGDRERIVRRRPTPASTSSAAHRDSISSGSDLISSSSFGSASFTSPEGARSQHNPRSTSLLVPGTSVNVVGSSQNSYSGVHQPTPSGFPFHAHVSRGSQMSFIEERLAHIVSHSTVRLTSLGSQVQTSTNQNQLTSVGGSHESRVRSMRDPRLMRDAGRSLALLPIPHPSAFAHQRGHLIQQLTDLLRSAYGEGFRYEDFLALQEGIRNVDSGLSQEAIMAGVGRRMYQSMGLGAPQENEMCTICQEDFVQGEEVGKLACRHDYHFSCIKQWLLLKNSCPICKMPGVATGEMS